MRLSLLATCLVTAVCAAQGAGRPGIEELGSQLAAIGGQLRTDHMAWIRSDHAQPNPVDAAIPKFRAIADQAPGTKVAERGLRLIIYYGGMSAHHKGAVESAIDDILEDHADSDAVGKLIRDMPMIVPDVLDMRERLRVLQRIRGVASREADRASASFHLGRFALSDLKSGTLARRQARARRYFARLVAEHPTSPWVEKAKPYLYEIDNLQIGMVAPNIVGKDLEGDSLELSDYRGKVVMLSFWGDW